MKEGREDRTDQKRSGEDLNRMGKTNEIKTS
jgi:hypothetical protein